MRLRLLLAVAAMSSGSLAAHADTFAYTVVFDAQNLSGSVATFTVPAILTTPVIVAAGGSGNLGGNQTVKSVEVYPTVGSCIYAGGKACFVTRFANDAEDYVYFDSNVTSPGVFSGLFGTVSITDVPGGPVSTTPEPSSITLLGTGLLGMAGVLRKRFA